jgi:hypothetical protein
MTRTTFAKLHDKLSASGCEVGIALNGQRLTIVVADPERGRALRFPVERDIDNACSVLVLSGALRERLARGRPPSDIDSQAALARGSWPELVDLAAMTT